MHKKHQLSITPFEINKKLLFIGISMNEDEIRHELESCFCTSDEIMDLQDGLFSNKDPFPIPRIAEPNGETAYLND